MSVEVIITEVLKGLAGEFVYPDVAPEGTVDKTDLYVTYQQVGGTEINFLDLTEPDKSNGRFQINCWGKRRIEVAALSRQVRKALSMTASLQTTVLGGPVALFEMDTGLRGTRQDFSFWFVS